MVIQKVRVRKRVRGGEECVCVCWEAFVLSVQEGAVSRRVA